MDHIAIMRKDWKLIPKILSGEKTIESRWYKYRVAPWNRVNPGDIIYFKDTGAPVTAKAEVTKVLQFETLDYEKVKHIVETYSERIALPNSDLLKWSTHKNYCILLFLQNSQLITPFNINKNGFGNAAAWLVVKDIHKVKLENMPEI